MSSFEAYQRAVEHWKPQLAWRRAHELAIEAELGEQESLMLPAYCFACSKHSLMQLDRAYSDRGHVNWRERLVCQGCGLNNRLRLSALVARHEVGCNAQSAIYLTEQVTPFAKIISNHYPRAVLSEYLGAHHIGGNTYNGVRHEDVTALSLEAGSFQAVLCFDVLEHVPDYKAALRQFRRVLAPGGQLFITVPFDLNANATRTRAKIGRDGQIQHLLPPIYHGDPLNATGGILCYYDFGWDFLDDLRRAGFADAALTLYWSSDYGHLGSEQLILSATA